MFERLWNLFSTLIGVILWIIIIWAMISIVLRAFAIHRLFGLLVLFAFIWWSSR